MTMRGPLRDRVNGNEKNKITEFGSHVNNYADNNYANNNSSPMKLPRFSRIMQLSC